MANQFQLAEAFTELTLRDRKYNERLNRVRATLAALQARMNVVARHAKRMLLITGGIAVLAVRAAAKQQDAEAKLEAVLEATGNAAGFTAKELKRLAAQLQKVTTFGDETTISALAILATFKEIKGVQFVEAIKQSQNLSVVMGQDLKSSVVQLGKALNDPIQGVSALQRVGVSFTESQKEQIKTLVTTGKVMEAQTLILDELATQFGGAATASAKTFGGQLKQLWNNFGDLLEVIGESLMPVLKTLSDWLTKNLPVIRSWIEANKDNIATWFKWGVAIAAILVLAPKILAFFGLLLAAWRAMAIAKATLLALSGPKGLILLTVGLAAAGAAAVLLTRKFNKLSGGIKSSWKEAKRLAEETKKVGQEQEKVDKRKAEGKRAEPKQFEAVKFTGLGPATGAAAAADAKRRPFREHVRTTTIGESMNMRDITQSLQRQQNQREKADDTVAKEQLKVAEMSEEHLKKLAGEGPRRWQK